ncbi:MAG: metallophosphoesterase [Promethearchaeota archaeon]
MANSESLSRKNILFKIISAGINISPNALKVISNAKFTDEDLSKFIQEVSFLKEFKSHITIDLIKKTKYAKLIKGDMVSDLHSSIVKNIKITSKQNKLPKKTFKKTKKKDSSVLDHILDNIGENKKIRNEFNNIKRKKIAKSENDSLSELIEPENTREIQKKFRKSSDGAKIVSTQKIDDAVDDNFELEIEEADKIVSEILNGDISSVSNINKSDNINQPLKKEKTERASISYFEEGWKNQTTKKSKDLNNLNKSNISLNTSNVKAKNQNSNINIKKKKLSKNNSSKRIPIDYNHKDISTKDSPKENQTKIMRKRFRGISSFKPLAKEYDEQINVLKDCNKYLYTSGTIEDFVELMRDKYNKLKQILQRNYEDARNAISIRQANLYSESREINVIGMILEKRAIPPDKYIMTIDDTTGIISVLVRKTNKNEDLIKNMRYLLEDHVVLIKGYLKVDNKRKSRIIFANEILFPDVFVSKREPIPQCPLSIMMISDIHIGSKNFIAPLFDKMIMFLRGEIGSERQRKLAGKIKYLVIAGDLVDGIGIYQDQDKELNITDIYNQFNKAAELISKIPDYIKIIYIPGNHEPIRKAIPHPVVPDKYIKPLLDLGVLSLGDPSFVSIHGIRTLLFHGDSFINMVTSIPGLSFNNSAEIMQELLKARHLCPTFGKRTELAPVAKDWLVIEEEPHLFHTGHIHINDLGYYKGILNVNSGCFQAQTSYMKNFGIVPTPGQPVIVYESNGKLNATILNLNE